MARIRTIKPEFWTSEQVVNCSMEARLLFIGMWNFCDDAGRHKASEVRLKCEVFPGDAVGTRQVRDWVRELVEADLVEEYEVEGESYWQVTGWDHQKIDQPNVRFPGSDGKITVGIAPRLGGKQRKLAYQKLVERDGERCVNCGSEHNLAVDHKMPRDKGGGNEIENLQLLCKPCNNEKFNKIPAGDSEGTRKVRGRYAPPEGNGRESKGKDKEHPTDVSGEQAQEPDSPPSNPGTPSEFSFPVTGKGPKNWNLPAWKLADYERAYPALNVHEQFTQAHQWLLANPKRRKTSGGMLAFLTGWLNRAQNRGGSSRGSPASQDFDRPKLKSASELLSDPTYD